jgi:hypothetical protein
MHTYYHRVIDSSEINAKTLQRQMNLLAKSGYALMAIASQGKLIIMVKERPPS